MADFNQFRKKYHHCESTFKETSFDDDNEVYLCTDESQDVINFDKVIEFKYPDSNSRPKSFDALYAYNDLLFCIEFKNQKPSQIDNMDIQGKLENGKAELAKMFQESNIQISNYSFVYCVVYKKCNEPTDRYKCGIDKNKVLFGLEKYQEQGVVKKVYTQSVDFFTKQFKKNLGKELLC